VHVFPGEVELAEYTKTIDDLIVETGLATGNKSPAPSPSRRPARPALPLAHGLLDEHHFTDIWVAPFRDRRVVRQSLRHPLRRAPAVPRRKAAGVGSRARRAARRSNRHAFREPPTKELLARYEQEFGSRWRCNWRLRPTSPSPATAPTPARPAAVARNLFHRPVQAVFGVNIGALREAIHRQHETHQSLPDVMVEWAFCTSRWRAGSGGEPGIPPCELLEAQLNQELYLKVGPSFWCCNRMLPILGGPIATATPPHAQLTAWLESKMGYAPSFVAELPGKIALLSGKLGVEFDADKMLVEFLAGKAFSGARTCRRSAPCAS